MDKSEKYTMELIHSKSVLDAIVNGIREMKEDGRYDDSEILADILLTLKAGGIDV